MSMLSPLEKLAQANASCEESPARKLLAGFFDQGTFTEIDRLARDGDKPAEAVAGYGLVNGAPVYAFAQDKAVCSGAIGKAQAAKISRIYELAAQNGAPVVGVFDSDGAKLGEGIDAMDAIAQVLLASNTLSGVVPQIAVITGACVGSSALVAAAADLVIMVKDGEYYLSKGDDVTKADLEAEDTDDAMEKARLLLSYLPSNNLASLPVYDFDGAAVSGTVSAENAAEGMADAGTLVYLSQGSDCKTAFAHVGGNVCGMVSLAGDKICACAAGRVARFVRLCDAFSIPVLTFVDAAGFQNIKAACKLSQAYNEATTAKISIIVGKAYGPVYIAVAGKRAGSDAVLAWPDAVISPLAPETAIHILWKDRLAQMNDPTTDRAKLAEEFAAQECSPVEAAANGYLTDVVEPGETKAKLMALLEMLEGKRVTRLPKKHANIQL